jgi:8-oxo-dGTP pyrophosphatase MutT (NUDIX family)
MTTRDRFEERIASHRATDPLLTGGRRAAVAALVRWDRNHPEVLLMQRAEREGDRWSGQVSLPGGRADERDADLCATAVRETREEVGVELDRSARLLGRLDGVMAVARGAILPMSIAPFVFTMLEEQPIVLGPEATAAFWLPLDAAASGELDGTYEYRLGPVPMSFACWRWEGRVVWGLTHKILRALLLRLQ